MKLNNKKWLFSAAMMSIAFSTASFAKEIKDEDYCLSHGGTVENMVAEFDTLQGEKEGFSKPFCTFHLDGGFIAVGLESYSSETPNIAATFIKTMKKIDENSPLLHGPYQNPGMNVCKNLNGSNIAFFVGMGGFKNELGQSNICVFGDGSMVSIWSLIYIANGRHDYGQVRDAIRSEPLVLGR